MIRIGVVVLRRKAAVDALVEAASGRIDREFSFELFEERLVVRRQTLDLVNVLDGGVGAVGSDLTRGVRKHAQKLLVVALLSWWCGEEGRGGGWKGGKCGGVTTQ